MNESSFKRARTELKEKGYISYEPQGGNQAPVYRMISLIENREDAQQVDSVGHGVDDNLTEPELAGEREARKGMAEETVTKPKQEAGEGEVFRFYQENFGVMSPFVIESMSDWVDDVGEALVMEAMKRALEQNRTSWGYVKSILQAWKKKGIRSVDAVQAEDVEFRNRKQRRRYHYFTSGNREEVIPDWFKEQREKRENKRMEVDPEEAEVTRLKEELGYG
ncbi:MULTISPECIES: DnaD domain-containing protein [Bacillaceae]|uniref:DnaD domain-containing protein n=1 Tax=Bacillaceae TaxID=186817 RepID=UPI0011A77F52|nr:MULTISPECIES: DnaD domain protein [Bacillaceae]MED4473962.1 DnaD domain protein [Oceanobacillus caeni]